MSLIETKELRLNLGGREILKGINFRMEEGDFQLIIGPNGAGKSSLSKCILGVHRNFEGSILLDGQPTQEFSSRNRARKVAYVPQILDLQFNLDVLSFLELSRFAHDEETPGSRDQVIDQSLALTGSEHLKHAFLDELSGGERQRILITAALAQQAKLLILDEPSQSLDPSYRVTLVNLLERLYETEKLTILLITHDWNEFLHLNPKVAAMKDGHMAFQIPAEELKSHLEPLFDCRFHHFWVKDRYLSVPKFR